MFNAVRGRLSKDSPRKVATATKTPPPPAPAPGPPDDSPPAPARVYVMDTGTMAVKPRLLELPKVGASNPLSRFTVGSGCEK